jgi:hypothetical protein
MDGRFHRRDERSITTYLLYSEDIARLISELLDATTDADPAWRDQVLGLIRLALGSNVERNEAPLLEAIATAWARDSNSGPSCGCDGVRRHRNVA